MKVIGRSFTSKVSAELEDDDNWKVIVLMEEGRRLEGQDVETKKVEAMSYAKDLGDAYTTAVQSAGAQLIDEFKKNGSQSLFSDMEDQEPLAVNG
jgi:hypothetical protein